MNSLRLWTRNDGFGQHLTGEERATEARFLVSRIKDLEKDFQKAVQDCVQEIEQSLTENIFKKFDHLGQLAADKAPTTVVRWGAPVNRENRAAGGYYWATYKGWLTRPL